MSRSNRHDYIASQQPPRMSRRAIARVLNAVGVTEAKAPKPQKPKKLWAYWSSGHQFDSFINGDDGLPTVEAHTRSEARAEVKKALGLSRHRPLPADILVALVDASMVVV